METTNESIRIWARVGAYVEVDKKKFLEDPENAMRAAVKKGKMQASGDSYIPQHTVHDELKGQQVDLADHLSVHELVKEDEEINFEV